MIIERITQDELAELDAVDVHNLFAGPVDHVQVTYHCGNTEAIYNAADLMVARDRIAAVQAEVARG